VTHPLKIADSSRGLSARAELLVITYFLCATRKNSGRKPT